MKTLTLETEEIMVQLLAALDADIQQLEENITAMDQLRCLVVKQDDKGLRELLSTLQSKVTGSRHNESKRQALRQELAAIYNCPVKEITLTRFAAELTGDMKRQFAQRKIKLQSLARLLKKEHGNTQRLLGDCARFNRMLLKSIFSVGRNEKTTYNAAGSAQRQTNTVFMNLQF